MVSAGRFTIYRSLAGSLDRDRGTLLLGLAAGGLMIALGALAGGSRLRAGSIPPQHESPVVKVIASPVQPLAESRPAPKRIAVAPDIRIEEIRKKRPHHAHKRKQSQPPVA